MRRQEISGWTKRIKRIICDYGDSLGYWATSSGYGGGHEWLYDVIWIDYRCTDKEKSGQYMKSIPLVVESEWGSDNAIVYDFEKLVVARAKLRLMIFGEKNTCNDKTVAELCRYAASLEGGEGDQYLFAGYESHSDGWLMYRYTVGCPVLKRTNRRWGKFDVNLTF